jgi:Neuraminidase (sialidase)
MDTPIDDRDAGLLETPSGALLVTTFTSVVYERLLAEAKDWDPQRLERWNAVQRATTQQQRQALTGAWMLRSTDGGFTWQAPFRVPVTSPHGPFALRDGRLLYPGKEYPGGEQGIGVCVSTDDGRTWRWLSRIPTRPGDTAVDYHELHGVEVRPGQLLVHIRNHNEANRMETLQTESQDGGLTWTEPHSIGVWGLPSHLLQLRDGRLLMSYSHRRPPRGNQARVSEDGGRTWSQPLLLSDDGVADLGYPSTVELPTGELLSLWYEVRPEAAQSHRKAVLRLARWRLG